MESSRGSVQAFVSLDTRQQLPRMARSWQASCQAAAVSVGGLFAVLIIAMVTHRSSPQVMAAGLAIPVLLFGAFTAYEWRIGRRLDIKLTRLHLIGVAAGLIVWLMYPAPGSLPFDPTSAQLCAYVGRPMVHACIVKADAARARSDIAWWSTGALIVVFGLFARRSRTAAWTAPAIAIAGSALAVYFLEVFLRAAAQGGFIS
ncbi:hypothetical protein GCM10023196_054180 [Actinoallomurus vinaceus]|uniref:Uncharacterized protein n=1 Tax=Actinoallomurus vinaceus TaxID=1080074 RepID=A0ABP8UHK2_9ACTN